MKKNIFLCLILIMFVFCQNASFAFGKKTSPTLYLTPYDPASTSHYNDNKVEPVNVFACGTRIYFSVYTKKGFKSNFIKYQIVKQDDNAHMGGYSRVMNRTVKVSNKHEYSDYFVINKAGKYFIQIFDIVDLQHWITMGAFAVVDN